MPLRPAALPADWPALEELFDEIERLDGYDPLTEEAYLAIADGGARPGIVATENGDTVGYGHLRDQRRITVLETAIHPACRPALAHLLLQALVGEAGAGLLHLWASEDETVAAAEELGFEEERRLLQLIRPLPPDEPARLPIDVEVARFADQRDVDHFLEVNNAAFAGHPDNGDWTVEEMRGRMSRPWFDADGLFLAWESGRPVGVCWTKMHPRRVGEIYVIAVHPEAQGRSLGTGLALTGLWDLHDRRGAETAMLYTEADNQAARRLYGRLGFDVLRRKRCLVRPALGEVSGR